MGPESTKEQLDHVVELVEEMGLTSHLIYGTNRTVVAAVGDKRMVDKSAIENLPGVGQLLEILQGGRVPRENGSQLLVQASLRLGMLSQQEPGPGERLGGGFVSREEDGDHFITHLLR